MTENKQHKGKQNLFNRLSIHDLTSVAAKILGVEHDELYKEVIDKVTAEFPRVSLLDFLGNDSEFHDAYACVIRKKLAEKHMFYPLNLN